MQDKTRNTIAISVFIWIGFVCSISFMEAWLKFRAPGVNLALGLSIGKLVFSALNKVEWFFSVIIAVSLLLGGQHILKGKNNLFMIAIVLLILQTFWMLPILNQRADLYMKGLEADKSLVHIYYVAAELAKTVLLFIFGLSFLKKTTKI